MSEDDIPDWAADDNEVRITVTDAGAGGDDTPITVIAGDDEHVGTTRVPAGTTIYVSAGSRATLNARVTGVQEPDDAE